MSGRGIHSEENGSGTGERQEGRTPEEGEMSASQGFWISVHTVMAVFFAIAGLLVEMPPELRVLFVGIAMVEAFMVGCGVGRL